jgi:hypothetical protein
MRRFAAWVGAVSAFCLSTSVFCGLGLLAGNILGEKALGNAEPVIETLLGAYLGLCLGMAVGSASGVLWYKKIRTGG